MLSLQSFILLPFDFLNLPSLERHHLPHLLFDTHLLTYCAVSNLPAKIVPERGNEFPSWPIIP